MRLIDAEMALAIAEAEFDKDVVSKIYWLISHVPTACDINKMVAKMENAKHEICLSDNDVKIYQSGIADSIEIAKQRGIE